MKNIYLYGILILILISIFFFIFSNFEAQVLKNENKSFKFNHTLIQVKESYINEPVQGTFTLHNLGDNALYVDRITPDCHCTSISTPSEPILPGDSINFVLEYDGKKLGVFQASAIIEFRHSDDSELLILRGCVILNEDEL